MPNRLEVVAFILILMAFIILIFFGIQLKNEGGECVASPLTYGIKKLEESNRANITCSCIMDKLNSAVLIATSQSIEIEQLYTSRISKEELPSLPNFSEIILENEN